MLGPSLHIRSVWRNQLPETTPLHQWLAGQVVRGVERGRAAPAIVVVREHTVDLMPVQDARGVGLPLPWLVAGLTTSRTGPGGAAEAVGVVGLLNRHDARTGRTEPVASVFLEWDDGRWWHWTAPVEGRSVTTSAHQVHSATDGDALPEGLGRWWSMGRRRGMQLDLTALFRDPSGGIEH